MYISSHPIYPVYIRTHCQFHRHIHKHIFIYMYYGVHLRFFITNIIFISSSTPTTTSTAPTFNHPNPSQPKNTEIIKIKTKTIMKWTLSKRLNLPEKINHSTGRPLTPQQSNWMICRDATKGLVAGLWSGFCHSTAIQSIPCRFIQKHMDIYSMSHVCTYVHMYSYETGEFCCFYSFHKNISFGNLFAF